MSNAKEQTHGRLDQPACKSLVGRRHLMTSLSILAAMGFLAQGAAYAQTTASNPEVGTIWWSELHTRDPERARTFYSQVIGWTPKVVALEDPGRPPREGEKEYTVFTVAGREAAGAMKMESTGAEGMAPGWFTYVQVSNVDAAALRAVELGGKLLEPPADAPNVGRIAIIQDPDGARVGLVAPVGGTR